MAITTREPTEPHSSSVSLDLQPPSPSSTAFLAGQTDHCIHSTANTTTALSPSPSGVERGRSKIGLWSIPASLLTGVTSALKPHTSPGAFRAMGHLEGHLGPCCLFQESWGHITLLPFLLPFCLCLLLSRVPLTSSGSEAPSK